MQTAYYAFFKVFRIVSFMFVLESLLNFKLSLMFLSQQTEKYLVGASMNHSLLLMPSNAENNSCPLLSDDMSQGVVLTSEKAYHFLTTVHRGRLESKLVRVTVTAGSVAVYHLV